MNHRYKKILTPIRVGDVVIRTRMGMSKCNSQEQQGPENIIPCLRCDCCTAPSAP